MITLDRAGQTHTHTHTQTDSDGSLMVICFSLISVKIMQKLYDVKFIIRTFKMRETFWVILLNTVFIIWFYIWPTGNLMTDITYLYCYYYSFY